MMGRIGVALVTGVSGHAAGVMADRLRAGGFEVRALVRTPDQAEAAAQRGLVPVPGDLTAPESLRPAVAGVSVVVHAAGPRYVISAAQSEAHTAAVVIWARCRGAAAVPVDAPIGTVWSGAFSHACAPRPPRQGTC